MSDTAQEVGDGDKIWSEKGGKVADIVILGAKKPKRCIDCRAIDKVTKDCLYCAESYKYRTFEEQYRHCPIVELPKGHGRLIDANKLVKSGIRYSSGINDDGIAYVPLGEVMSSIRNAETVIPAEQKEGE